MKAPERERRNGKSGKAGTTAGSKHDAARIAPAHQDDLAQRVGNRGLQRFISDIGPAQFPHRGDPPMSIQTGATGGGAGRVIQAKRAIGASSDPLEQEADRFAEHALASTRQGAGNRPGAAISPLPATPRGATQAAPESVERTLASPGSPLPATQRRDMEQRLGADFGAVRVHTGASAEQSAHDINAKAYTAGTHVVFGAGQFAPGTGEGRRLLAHELTHVIQQTGGAQAGAHADRDIPAGSRVARSGQATAARTGVMIQRAIKPEDVASEMVGRDFELADAFVSGGMTLAKGAVVSIVAWGNTDIGVTVLGIARIGGIPFPSVFVVPKTLLRPVRPSGARLDPYSTGIESQAKAVAKNEAAAAGATGAEKTRLEGLLVTRREVLNRKLIQETMFNRFDPIIVREVTAANAAHKLTGADALDPDMVKSMLFQESEMGTAGTHLEVPPTHPVKSRFNLGQVIDSSGLALLTMLEREQPNWVASFFLGDQRSDLGKAQTEKATLEKKATRTVAENARLVELKRLAVGTWETFIWEYKAPGKTTGFADAIAGFFASTSPARNMDYEFWIHMAVLWLFEKKTPKRTWLETIKAYNGSGKRAEHYRDAVVRRAAAAETAAKAGKPFAPTR